MDVKLNNESDITRLAMGMIPVSDIDELVVKMNPYKTASLNIIRELVRKVNIENQYGALKTAEFEIDKAANTLCTPFDPEVVIHKMGKKEVGTLKAASATTLSFGNLRKTLYTGKTDRVKAKKNAVALFRQLRKEGSYESKDKLQRLKIVAKAKKASVMQSLKMTAKDIADLLGRDTLLSKKYAKAFTKYRSLNILPVGLPASKVVKWAALNDRFQSLVKSLELINHVLED